MAKRITKAFKIIDGGDMSGNVTSTEIPITFLDNVGIQVTWTGTPNGEILVDGRVHEDAPWTAMELDPVITPAGTASDHLIRLDSVPYATVRLRYARSSGTGTLNAWAMAKTQGS